VYGGSILAGSRFARGEQQEETGTMAVLMQARVHGLSEQQYEELIRGSFIDRLRSSGG